MANSITNLSSSNTFLQWLTATQSAITLLNKLTEGGACNDVFVANTNIEISNNVTITGNLTVGGNITLDAVGFDDLIVTGSAAIGTTLNVTGNANFGAAVTMGLLNQSTANIGVIVGAAGNFVNSASNHANSGFLQANSAFNHANSGFIQANSGFLQANSSFLKTNAGFSVANSASIYANGAFAAANAAATDSLAFSIALG